MDRPPHIRIANPHHAHLQLKTLIFDRLKICWVNIAQIAPVSFKTSIPHRSGQLPLSGHQHVCITEETLDERRLQLNTTQYTSYKPQLNFKSTWIFWRFSFKWHFWHKQKKSMLVLGPHGKDREYQWDKENIINPKVNRACPTLDY